MAGGEPHFTRRVIPYRKERNRNPIQKKCLLQEIQESQSGMVMRLFQYLRIRIFHNPLTPLGVLGGNFGEPSFEIFPLDAHEALSIRIPEAIRLSVV